MVLITIAIAVCELFRENLPTVLCGTSRRLLKPVFSGLQKLHNGLIGDYVAWISIGFAAVIAAFTLL